MSSLIIQSETLTSIANAIRAKTGNSGTLTPSQMATEIGNISSGGGDSGGSSGGTITGIDLSNGCSFYTILVSDTTKSGLDLSKISSVISNNKDFYYIGQVEETWGTCVVAHFKGTQFQEMLAYENTSGYDSAIETDLSGTTWPNVQRMYGTGSGSAPIGFILALN